MKNEDFFYLYILFCIVIFLFQIYLIANKNFKGNKHINKLYSILYENIKDKDVVNSICCEIYCLSANGKIYNSEAKILLKHFRKQKPNFFKFNKFYLHPLFSGKGFWWYNNYSCESSIQESSTQRKLFVKELISKTSSDFNGNYK